MSKGSQVITLRPGDALLAEMDRAIEEMNRTRIEEPFTRTSWLVTAIREKLAKRQRSNRSKRKHGQADHQADHQAEGNGGK